MKIRDYVLGPCEGYDEACGLVEDLDLALMRELPAFRVTGSVVATNLASVEVTIETDDSTPDWAFQRLEGFPVKGLVLRELVA